MYSLYTTMKYSSYSKVQFFHYNDPELSGIEQQFQTKLSTSYLLLSLQLSSQFQPLDNSVRKSHWFIPLDSNKYFKTI